MQRTVESVRRERLRATAAGFAVVVAAFGGKLVVRVLSRFLRAIVWFAETVATFGFALLLGYLAYRVLGGDQ